MCYFIERSSEVTLGQRCDEVRDPGLRNVGERCSRQNSKRKGSEARAWSACLRKSKEAAVAGSKWLKAVHHH